jgi:hypothetical protein
MKKREKLLLAGLVAVLVLWQGGNLINAYVFAPVEEREAGIVARRKLVNDKTFQLAQSRKAARKLKEWKQRSLPGNPFTAISQYQVWLVDLANRSKLEKVGVDANRTEARRKGETYSVITANIKAQGTLEHLCDFLYEFRRSGLLHRVAQMTLTSEQYKGNPVLDISLRVEGLSLKDAPVRTTLLSDEHLADLPGDKPLRDRKAYSQLLAKNLFVRGYPPPPTRGQGPRNPSTTIPEEDPREFVFLVGSFSTDGVFDATLYDRANNKTRQLVRGGDFSIAGVEGEVVSIEVDAVTLKIKGEVFRLELGDSLAQLKKLPAPAKAGTDASAATDASDAG